MKKTLSEELNDMADDVLKKQAGAAKRLQKQKFLLLVGLVVMFTSITLGPKINKHIDEKTKWNIEHLPNIAIVFQPDDYFRGVKSLKLYNRPYFTCQCYQCPQYLDKNENAWKYQSGFVITEQLEVLLKITGVRYQRKDIGYNNGCPYQLNEVMSEPFVNW